METCRFLPVCKGLGFRVQGFRGLGFRGLGFRVLGFRVQGLRNSKGDGNLSTMTRPRLKCLEHEAQITRA